MINKDKLCKFLIEAKKSTYAAGDQRKNVTEKDGSTSLVFEKDNFRYHDNYFGGEPFGGREVVFVYEKAIYMMTYYGFVDKSVSDFQSVYKVLQNALSLIPEDHPFRGPKEYTEGDLTYRNSYTGEIENFSGEETITTPEGKVVFKTKYIGGFVDQRK